MATYYVDPAAIGDNDGSSWANAWVDLQSAFTTVTAGNTVYCRGTVGWDNTHAGWATGNAGTDFEENAIRFVGCDAAGTPRAGQFTINAVATKRNEVAITVSHDYIIIENFTVSNNLQSSFSSGSKICKYIKCISLSSASYGFTNTWGSFFIDCQAINAGNNGFHTIGVGLFLRCIARGCAGAGIYADSYYGTINIIDCLMYKNTSHGISLYVRQKWNTIVSGNVCHGSIAGSGIYFHFNANNHIALIAKNRLTGNARYGLELSGAFLNLHRYLNGFHGNTLGEVLNTTKDATDLTLTANGYTDVDTNNYTLLDNAEGRRVGSDIDWDSVTILNKAYSTIGIAAPDPTQSSGSAGGPVQQMYMQGR